MSIHRFAAIAAGSVLALALVASPALAGGSPLAHYSYLATDLNAEGPLCGYTFTSGSLTIVYRTADVYPGQIGAAHTTLHDVWATKDDTLVRVLGSETYTDLAGRLTFKLFFVEPGSGLADSVNVVFRNWADGSWHFGFERDSCHLYG
jgi:hypothetical protein